MLEIQVRRWVAVWYRCPKCGSQTADTMLTPWRYRHNYVHQCSGWQCDRCELEVVERKWYTTFCIEPGIQTTIAGTLAKIGPFKLCDIIQPNVRAFRRWYRQRRAERDEQARQYYERQRQIDAEAAARHERQRKEAVLLKEAAEIAYRREHAAELAAEQVARAVWPNDPVDDFLSHDDLSDLYDDDHLF